MTQTPDSGTLGLTNAFKEVVLKDFGPKTQTDDSKPSESLRTVSIKGELSDLVEQQLELESYESFTLLRELRRARESNMGPSEAWALLHSVAEKRSLEPSCVFPNVVHLSLREESTKSPFFTGMLKWFVLNYKREEDPKKPTDFAIDNPYIGEARSLLVEELSRHLAPISRMQDLIISLPAGDHFLRKQSHRAPDLIEHACDVVTLFVKNNLVDLVDVWPHLGSDEFLHDLDGIYKSQIDTCVEASRQEHLNSSLGHTSFVSLVSRFRSHQEASSRSWQRIPLRVIILTKILKFRVVSRGIAIFFFEKYKDLAFAFAPLRFPLLALLKSQFDNKDSVFKMSLLNFAVKILGLYIGLDPVFFEQVCTFCQNCLGEHGDLVTDLITQLIFPALTLCYKSEQAASSVWIILSKLDSRTRSQLYTRWLRDSWNSSHVLKAIASLLEEDLSALMPQLTLETMETVGKSIGNLVTGCPLVAWKQILLHVLWTEDRVPVLVQLVVSHCDAFAQDTLMFSIYDILADKDRLPFKEDGISLQPWFQSLSMLIGCLFARSSYLQDSCLLTYVSFLEKQISTRAACLHLFLDLLTAMSGIKPLMKLSETEVAALGGSALLKRQILLSSYKDKSLVGQQTTTAAFGPSQSFLSSVKILFSALHQDLAGVKILAMLSKIRVLRDSSVIGEVYHRRTSSSVFLQFLFVMNFYDTAADECGINSDVALLCDKTTLDSPPLELAVKRALLRSKVESHRLDFFNEFLPMSDDNGVDPKWAAFLWTLDAYDVYVPEAEYVHETTRIESSRKTSEPMHVLDAASMSLIDSLKASHATHKAHVAWLLPLLPKVNMSESLIKMALMRASKSQQDAHFVFCFLARTLNDPIPLLRSFFDREKFSDLFFFSREYEILGIGQLVTEIWRDMRSWPFQKVLEDPCVLQSGTRSHEIFDLHISTPTEGIRDSYGTCTLFRRGMEVETLLPQWEEETVAAISAALNSLSSFTVNRALKTLIRLADFLPHRHDLRYSLIERQLPVLARDAKDCDVAALARKAIEIFSSQKMDVDVCADTENKEDDVFSDAAKRRKQDSEEMGTKLIQDQGSSIRRRRSLRNLRRVSSKRRL